jgi:hypothetical protein
VSDSLQAPRPEPPRPARFLFRGSAVAAGGYLTSRKGQAIRLDPKRPTTHGETNLPTVGGVSQSVVTDPDLPFREFIEYGRCETSGTGIVEGDTAVTRLSAAVHTVRVTTSPSPEDMVPGVRAISLEADRLSLAIRSAHKLGDEPYFEIEGVPETKSLALVISRPERPVEVIPIELQYYERVLARNTLAEFDRTFREDPELFETHASRSAAASAPRTREGYIMASIVRSIRRGDRIIRGNVLREPGFGTIFFGEMLINDYNRRISLVRIELGSDPAGRAMFASPDPNGIWS